MRIHRMDLSRIMFHAMKIEEHKRKKVCRELDITRAGDGNSSKTRFEVGINQSFKKTFSNKFPPNTPRVDKCKLDTPKSQKGKGGSR